MNRRADAAAALEMPLRAGDDVEVRRQRKVSVVHSVRMPRELTERLYAEAERRGVTPSRLIRDLVAAELEASDSSATVLLADVHRVIDALARKSA